MNLNRGEEHERHRAFSPFARDPDDMAGDEDLQFDLRYKNAEMRQVNVQLSKTRGENLEQQGAFRTFLAPTTGFRRRAGQQNWSEQIHQVQSAGANGRVEDTEGNSYQMSLVKAIPSSTAFVPVPDFALGGSRKVDDRRREALRSWLPTLLDMIRRGGTRVSACSGQAGNWRRCRGSSRRSETKGPV